MLHSCNPTQCMCVLHWSYMARPSSLQSITANDMTLHGRGCGHVSVELHVVVCANV